MKTDQKYEKMHEAQNESGVVLVAVVCFVAIAAILAAGLMSESSSQLKIARKNVNLEKAFYVAEGGAERAGSYIRQMGVTATTCITGSIGNGNYVTFIVPLPGDSAGASTGGTHSLSGSLNINPNNSPDNEFLLLKPDGTSITRDDLANDTTEYDSEPCVYYTGPAMLVHVKPKGAGNQNTLIVDGVVYTLDNSTTYDFVGDMNVVVQNDSRNNGNHRANGQWQLGSISGDDVTLFDGSVSSSTGTKQYEVRAIGTVEDTRRSVILEGVHQETWARFAFWYNSNPGGNYLMGPSVFGGPVHANSPIYLWGNPTFNGLVTSAASTWGQWSAAAIFNQGFQLGVPAQSMSSINFTNTANSNTCLRLLAGLVVTGATSIRLQDTNLFISNTRRGWTNVNYVTNHPGFLGTGLIYVASAGVTGGTVQVGGMLDGRLTVVAESNIWITNHITYAVHPTNNSDDALGLIARNDVVVKTNAPNNINIFAHIIACDSRAAYDSGFYVENFYTRPDSGVFTVYGGIVANNYGVEGVYWGGSTFTGFSEDNWTYDTRFENNPPPFYPNVTNTYTWNNWRETP